MKKLWAVRKDSEAVSPVIATILMVAITVVLAAVLYVMVLGFGGTGEQTPTASLTKETVTGGVKLTFTAVSPETLWTDLTVLLTDGTDTVSWTNLTNTDLDDDPGDMQNYGAKTLTTAAVAVTLKVTDQAGNGYANGGDYFTLVATFAANTDYTLSVVYDPNGATMCDFEFRV